MTKLAFLSPTERRDMPEGGFCISVFAIIRRGEEVLLKPSRHER